MVLGPAHRVPGFQSLGEVPNHHRVLIVLQDLLALGGTAAVAKRDLPQRMSEVQSASQVLRLCTRFPYKVLSLSTKPEVPW
jgi:hypothetical protein